MTVTRLGVVVPCRDEATIIGARLADLSRAAWPDACSGAPHVVVVVDDGSIDGTADRARAAQGALAARGVALHVTPRAGAPGKPAAIRTGLARLADLGLAADTDLVVLTDADVTMEPGALLALAAAFSREPRLGMASGAQRYAAGQSGVYDRLFALARRLESRFGGLLSVHGQLLAWRASLGLSPPDGRAADDLELVREARDRPRPPRVRVVPAAVFHERRAPDADAQLVRRARAWFQHFDGPPPRRPLLRLQWRLWSLVPGAARAAAWPIASLAPGVAARRRLVAAARAAERDAPLAAHWEVARG